MMSWRAVCSFNFPGSLRMTWVHVSLPLRCYSSVCLNAYLLFLSVSISFSLYLASYLSVPLLIYLSKYLRHLLSLFVSFCHFFTNIFLYPSAYVSFALFFSLSPFLFHLNLPVFFTRFTNFVVISYRLISQFSYFHFPLSLLPLFFFHVSPSPIFFFTVLRSLLPSWSPLTLFWSHSSFSPWPLTLIFRFISLAYFSSINLRYLSFRSVPLPMTFSLDLSWPCFLARCWILRI